MASSALAETGFVPADTGSGQPRALLFQSGATGAGDHGRSSRLNAKPELPSPEEDCVIGMAFRIYSASTPRSLHGLPSVWVLSQLTIRSMISLLFLSSISVWPLPRMPAS